MAPVSGVFPADAPFHLLEIGLQAVKLSPYRADPAALRFIRLNTTAAFLACYGPFNLSNPGRAIRSKNIPPSSSQLRWGYDEAPRGATSAGHRPRRAGRVKGGAVRGPRTPHSTVATRCPSGTRDPTTTTSRAASTRKPGRSRVRAMSVRYDPAFHGQPRSLPATLARRSATMPRLPVGFPS